MSVGYSATPLARKLGFKSGQRVWQRGMPDSVARQLAAEAPEVRFLEEAEPPFGGAHLFTRSRAELEEWLPPLRERIASDGMIWVSWPKRSSGVATDVTEDVVREIALPLGLVDTKVCAVDATWSGLRLVIRKALR